MNGSGKTGLITHDSRFDFFTKNTKLHELTVKFHNLDLSGLLLLAAGTQCMDALEDKQLV